MPVAGLRSVTLRHSLGNGDTAVNVFHVKQDTPSTFTLAEATALASIFDEDWWSEFKTGIVSGCTLDEIEVRDASGATGLAYTIPVGEAGGAANTPLPYQVALVVSWRSATAGRSFRGRTYVAGWNESANNASGRIDAALVISMLAAAAALHAELIANDYALVVYSRKLDVATPITTWIVDNKWDIQRRRDNN